jgi:hypothetical protein
MASLASLLEGCPLNPIFMLGGAPKAHEVLSKMSRIVFFSRAMVFARGISDQG